MEMRRTLAIVSVLLIMLLVAFAGAPVLASTEETAGMVVRFEGLVESRPTGDPVGAWVIEERAVQVTASTRLVEALGEAAVGAKVAVTARQEGDNLIAIMIRVVERVSAVETVLLQGPINELGTRYLVVNTVRVQWNESTRIEGRLAVGAFVKVEAIRTTEGLLARRIVVTSRPGDRTVEITGPIQSMEGDVWRIAEQQVVINATTTILGTPAVGKWAHVHALVRDDTLIARRIVILEPQNDEPKPVSFLGVIQRLPEGLIGRWLISGRVVEVTVSTTIIGTPHVNDMAHVDALRYRDGSVRARSIQVIGPEPTRTPRTPPAPTVPPPTRTPRPTSAWDGSSLAFVAVGRSCEEGGTVSATVLNRGPQAMAGPVTWELYYTPRRDDLSHERPGERIAEGSLAALAPRATAELVALASRGTGTYVFKVTQRPGHPGNGVVWSNGVYFSAAGCPAATPTPTPSAGG
jgi:hypothetical protein